MELFFALAGDEARLKTKGQEEAGSGGMKRGGKL